jgi:hypothetical protein
MKSTTFTVRRQYNVQIPISVGDYVIYDAGHRTGKDEGSVTYFFDDGNQCIIDDKHTIHTSMIKEINGVDIKYIEGEMTVI